MQKNGAIRERVIDIVTEEMGLTRPIDEAVNLTEDLGADSLDLTEIFMGVEEDFDIEIDLDMELMDKIKTVGDLIEYVKTRVAN